MPNCIFNLLVIIGGLVTLFIIFVKPKIDKEVDKIKNNEVVKEIKEGVSEAQKEIEEGLEGEGSSEATEEADLEEQQKQEDDKAKKTAKKFSTKKRPNIGDYEWFYKYYYKKGANKKIKKFYNQKKAKKMDNKWLTEGGWKLMMIGNKSKYHVKGDRMLNIFIINKKKGKDVKVKFDWWVMHDNKGRTYKEKGNTKVDCKWNNKFSTISGNGIKISNFMTFKGKQYALGNLMWESGENDYLILVRK